MLKPNEYWYAADKYGGHIITKDRCLIDSTTMDLLFCDSEYNIHEIPLMLDATMKGKPIKVELIIEKLSVCQ